MFECTECGQHPYLPHRVHRPQLHKSPPAAVQSDARFAKCFLMYCGYLVISCHVIIHDAPCGTVRNGAERCGTVRNGASCTSHFLRYFPRLLRPSFCTSSWPQPQLPRSRAAAQLLRSSWVLMALGRSCLFAMTSSTASFNQQFLAVSQNLDPNPQIQ